jgi:hypothetical protein
MLVIVWIYYVLVGVSISGSIRFSSKKITKLILKKKQKSVQTNQFRFGLVRLIEEKNWKNQFIFFGFFMTFDGVI